MVLAAAGGIIMSVRIIHPGAWWLWALGLAIAASRTTDPLLLSLLVAVATVVVAARASAEGRSSYRFYLVLAMFVVAVRIIVRIVFGGGATGDVLWSLPELPVPDWAVGLRIGGPVTSGELRAAFADGLRLAAMLVAIGAANALADPRRLLPMLPRALHDIGTAVVVAVSLVPQVVASAARVHRAQRLRRGRVGRRGRLVRRVMPIVDDALVRSVRLGTAMEVRGFGRDVGAAPPAAFWLLSGGVAGTGIGLYGVLDGSAPRLMGPPIFVAGLALVAIGIRVAGHHRRVTVYRRNRWAAPEWLIVASGVVAAAAVMWISLADPNTLNPRGLPTTPVVAIVAVVLAALPAWLARQAPSPRSVESLRAEVGA